MAKKKKAPELTFQQHLADYLVRVHGYGVLEQSEITDTEHGIAEDQLWAFLQATQSDTLKKMPRPGMATFSGWKNGRGSLVQAVFAGRCRQGFGAHI